MARTMVLPRKWIETSRPPRADWLAERAAGGVAKVPTAKPPTAPTAAPIRNLVVPSPNRKLPSCNSPELRRGQFSTAIRRGGSSGDLAGYTERRMVETGNRERLRGLPAVDAVLRGPAGEALAGRHGRAKATAAIREVLDRLRREIVAGERPEVSEG